MSTDSPRPETFSLTLDDAEKSELLGLLDVALGDLRVEIHRSHTPDYREQLLRREELLRRLIAKFRPGSP
jgi:hypothetical protein